MINKITGIKVLIVPMAVALALLVSIFYVKPVFDEMQLAKKDQVELKNQLSGLEGQNKKLSDLKAKWDTMSDEKTLVEGSLPVGVSADYYISQLYEQASRSGVLISSVSTDVKSGMGGSYVCGSKTSSIVADSSSSDNGASDAEDAPKPKKSKSSEPAASCVNMASMSISVSGSWDQVLSFFKYLEESNRIANILSVDISGSNDNDSLTVEIQTATYHKDRVATAGSSVASGLASGKGFEEGVIKKLKEIVFAPFVAPSVSESGERNVFK
jgi:Tfp pilus assembly protein PilO